MIRRHALVVVASLVVAGCIMATNLSGPSDLGVPAAIGDWTVSDVTPDPKTDFGKSMAEFASVFMEAAGATDSTGAWAIYEVRKSGVLVTRVEGFRVTGATPEAMWRGADAIGIGSATAEATTSSGWDVRHGADDSQWAAVRGDRLFALSGGPSGTTRDHLLQFLGALK